MALSLISYPDKVWQAGLKDLRASSSVQKFSTKRNEKAARKREGRETGTQGGGGGKMDEKMSFYFSSVVICEALGSEMPSHRVSQPLLHIHTA
jgi:hypothetical protein